MLGSVHDLIVIAIVALIVVGPKKLPDLARTLGKGLSEFKQATSGITDEFKDALKEEVKPEHHDAVPLKKTISEETKNEISDNDSGKEQKSKTS